jgi:hypothetical protein
MSDGAAITGRTGFKAEIAPPFKRQMTMMTLVDRPSMNPDNPSNAAIGAAGDESPSVAADRGQRGRIAMADPRSSSGPSGSFDDLPPDLGHPRGTLAIVVLFGLLFGLAWLATYLFVFLERGAPHH